MTDRPSDRRSPLPRAARGGRRRARSTSASTTWSRRASGGSSATTPSSARALGLHDRRRPARRRQPRRGPRRDRGRAAHLAAIEAIDPAELSAAARFERDLELHNVRRGIFDIEELRHLGAALVRRSTRSATRSSSLFARDHAPLAERLDAITGRLEAVAAYLEASKTRATVPQVRRWQRARDRGRRTSCPVSSTRSSRPRTGVRRPGRGDAASSAPRRSARVAVEAYSRAGCAGPWRRHATTGRSAASATTSWSRLRAFDGLDADAILELGWQQLAEEKAARVAAAREIDPDADEAAVVTRIKADQPGRLRRRPSRPTATRCSARAST